MTDAKSTPNQRLTQVTDFFTMNKTAMTTPWDPNSTIFPTRKELPKIPGAPPEAAWFWGEKDNLGRLNLLTPTRVAAAAKEIISGEIVPVNLPLDVPSAPAFDRQPFHHEIKTVIEGVVHDDIYTLNTQSGTQWDGFRHFAHLPSATFYNNTKAADILGPAANDKCSIHHWAAHGIAGRALLLDYRHWATTQNITYNPLSTHAISFGALAQCGRAQGIDIRPAAQGGDVRPGDMLFVRSGWKEAYDALSEAERAKAGLRHASGPGGSDEQQFAGLAQDEEVKSWLHDGYFAAVAGDSPTFEAWPPGEGSSYLHESILSLWGMPIGEMLDLERLAQTCRQKKRWFFFFTSAPANCVGGVGSHVNGTAIF